MSMTAERRGELLRDVEHHWSMTMNVPTRDELRELLTAHEELERAVALLRRSNGYLCLDKRRQLGTAAPVDGCTCRSCRIAQLIAAHDARTSAAATTAGEAAP